jgi:hypothetical protein
VTQLSLTFVELFITTESLLMNLSPPDPKLAAMLSTAPVVPDKPETQITSNNTNINKEHI